MPDASVSRWRQRFGQYLRALALFKSTEAERRIRVLNDAERAGLVQFFESTVETGWKTLGAVLRAQLVDVAMTPMAVVRAAAEAGLISDPDRWAKAIEHRNQMAHVYDVEAFEALVAIAGESYMAIFDTLQVRLAALEIA